MHDALLKAVVVHLIANRPHREMRSDAYHHTPTLAVVTTMHLIVATKVIR